MQDINVDEALWASSMLPEGVVERWIIADGAIVAAGDPMAEIRIEDALHEITVPASGRLTIIAAVNTVVEPGSLLARLAVAEPSPPFSNRVSFVNAFLSPRRVTVLSAVGIIRRNLARLFGQCSDQIACVPMFGLFSRSHMNAGQGSSAMRVPNTQTTFLGKTMIIEFSDQVPRVTLFKRFPVPRNFKVTPESRIETGRTWSALAGAMQTKAFEIYRYDPDSGGNPRLDTFHVDLDNCGPMVLDALFWIKNKVDSTRTFRRSCREGICGSCAMNMDGANWLACTRFISEMAAPATIYPHANMRIIKDFVPRLTHVFAQYAAIEPWLRSKTPERRNDCNRRRNAAS